MLDNVESQWPPEGFVAIGDYAFEPPYIPTELQLEQAEQFIFTDPTFANLDESQRRRNVIRLAIAAASSDTMGTQEGATQKNYIPLIGGGVQMETVRHEGTPIHTYTTLKEN